MTLGEKIKKARTEKRITQSELCGDKITRNMLSCIENGKASPSLDTLKYIAARLSLPVSYLVSDEDDTFFYIKREEMKFISAAYRAGSYGDCIKHIERIGRLDDELSYLLAQCHYELGRAAVLRGSLTTAVNHLRVAENQCRITSYDTRRIRALLPMYTALAKNIQSPLLELDAEMFGQSTDLDFELEFYKYIHGDLTYQYRNSVFAKHVSAKLMMRERDYQTAISLMREIEDEKTPRTYNACVMFGIYTDLENCYRQLTDFENAYRYASKRISMIEGFKS